MFDDTTFKLEDSERINAQTYSKFTELRNTKQVKQTHLFNGRYENIYIDTNLIPTLKNILEFANQCAQKSLHLNKILDIGFWFNDMPPGSVTTAHTHDDDDELLSGVYYIKVPKQSGNLILRSNQKKKVITPEEGQLILFKPDCLHEVTKNKSTDTRLSIGMNFGIRQT